MFRQRRPLLRSAVMGGSAQAAGRRSARRNPEQAQLEDEQNERIADSGQREPPRAGSDPSVLDQLSRLTALHQQGALSDCEFTAAKAKILGT
jgi:hypothetical protein